MLNTRHILYSASVMLALSLANPAFAQVEEPEDLDPASGEVTSLSVTAAPGTRELQNALARLASNSRDVDSLLDAGNAALLLKDSDAALGFFARAEQIDAGNGRVKAGLASAVLGTGNPYEALKLYGQAVNLGVAESAIAGDRGLAFDLVGDNASAQRDYQLALKRGGDDEITRRYALSLGITGKRREAEALLTPLLNQNDAASWRTRTFVLAIDKDMDGAMAIANGTMSPRMASSLAPFLRYMPKLTPSQQAAAAHYGRFPKAADIGRDDPRNAQYAGAGRVSNADAGLIPAGAPLGAKADDKPVAVAKVDKKARRRPGKAAEKADNPVQVAVANTIPPQPSPVPKPPAPTTVANTNIAAPPATVVAAQQRLEASVPAPANTGAALPGFASLGDDSPGVAQPAQNFDLAALNSGTKPLPPMPIPDIAAAPPPASFAELMSDIYVPAEEKTVSAVAVDLTQIEPAKPRAAVVKPPEPAKPKEPPKPANPSRYWAQVAGGSDKKSLPKEWQRLVKAAPDAFKGKQPWTTPLRFTNRLLTGPFDSEAAAQNFVNQVAKADITGFVWTSAAGQEIEKLAVK